MKMEKSGSHTDGLSILLIIAMCTINSLFSWNNVIYVPYGSLKRIVSP